MPGVMTDTLRRQKKRLDQARHGQRVLAFDDKDNTPVYSTIVGFTGAFPNAQGSGLRIAHSKGELIVSETHLLLALIDGKSKFVQADELTVNSTVFVDFRPVQILSIESGMFKGCYNPLTEEGTIVVNGIMASCHTVGPHALVRTLYQPLNWWLDLFPRPFGSLPTDDVNEHWFAIGLRRSVLGSTLSFLVTNVLSTY